MADEKNAPKKPAVSKPQRVNDPSGQTSRGFLLGLLALLLVIAAVIAYIVWSGRSAETDKLAEEKESVNFTAELKDDSYVSLHADDINEDATEVDLYEDFSCPYCKELAVETDDEMKKAVEDGKLVVNVHTLNFLDGENYETNTGHSTRALAAIDVLARNGETEPWWNARKYLMENQENVSTWEAKDFAELAKAFGASKDSVKQIEDSSLNDAQNVGAKNAKKLKDQTGKLSSPRVLIDGKDIDTDIYNWVEKAVEH